MDTVTEKSTEVVVELSMEAVSVFTLEEQSDADGERSSQEPKSAVTNVAQVPECSQKCRG